MWNDIKDYEGLYQVSTEGEVRSLERTVITRKGARIYKGRLLKPNIGTNGYYYVVLSKNGILNTCYIHKLVAETFLETPENIKAEVDHINENKLDNRLENLQYLSHFANSSKSNKGRNRYDKHLEKNPRAKAVIGIENGMIVEDYDCAKKITMKYNINYSTLRKRLQNNNCKIGNIEYYYEDNFKEKI